MGEEETFAPEIQDDWAVCQVEHTLFCWIWVAGIVAAEAACFRGGAVVAVADVDAAVEVESPDALLGGVGEWGAD